MISPAPSAPHRGGFTLVNLAVSVAVIAVLAGMVMVSLEPDERARVLGATQLLAADIEYAQALSLAEPGDPVIVRLDPVNDGYWLERTSTPNTPISRSNGTAFIVIFGEGDAAPFVGVDLAVSSGATDNSVVFDGFGRLTELSDAVLAVALADNTMKLTTSSTTGFVDIAWAEEAVLEGGGIGGAGIAGGKLGG